MADSPSDGNLRHWEELAAFHGRGQDSVYDIEALVRGDRSLRPMEMAGLDIARVGRPVAELRVAHVQSHIGFDSVHLARLGAQVTAFDFSPTALARLDEIAAMCGVDIQTVEADSQSLADASFTTFHGRFDIVYATIGVICWIADLHAWMRGAAALLRPGGRLMLLEIHPIYQMGESFDPLVLDFPYRNDGPRRFVGTGSYANPDADLAWSVEQYAWSVGEVVNAAIDAGMRVVRLDEHTDATSDPRGDCLVLEEDGMYRLRAGRGAGGGLPEALPVLFTLVAEKE